MSSLFMDIVNMSVSATYIAIVVIILRFALKKAPKRFSCLMWVLVAIRLVCPFSIESIFSLMPTNRKIAVETPSFNMVTDNIPDTYGGSVSATNGGISSGDIIIPAQDQVNVAQILAIIWVIGVLVMLCYSFVSFFRMRNKVKTAVKIEDNIKLCDEIKTPFILGVFKPNIYIPFNSDMGDREYITKHEKTHIERGDHIWKPFGFLLLAFYWFNPVLWIAYILFCKDIELACDERVIMEMGVEKRKCYSNALVNCSVPGKLIAATPLAFGEVAVKKRINFVLNYKKPAFWVSVVAVVLIVATSVCFLTDPVSVNTKETTSKSKESQKQEIPTTENSIPVVQITESVTEKTTEKNKISTKVNNKITTSYSGNDNTTQKGSENDTTNGTIKETEEATTQKEIPDTTEKLQSTDPEFYYAPDNSTIVLTFTNELDSKGNYVKRHFSVPTYLLIDGYDLAEYNYNDYMTPNDGKYNYLALRFSRGASPNYKLTIYYEGERFYPQDRKGYEQEYEEFDVASETYNIKTRYYDASGNFLYKKETLEIAGAEIYETQFDTNDGWSAMIHEEYFPDDKWEFYTDATGNPVTKEAFEAHLSTKKIR